MCDDRFNKRFVSLSQNVNIIITREFAKKAQKQANGSGYERIHFLTKSLVMKTHTYKHTQNENCTK